MQGTGDDTLRAAVTAGRIDAGDFIDLNGPKAASAKAVTIAKACVYAFLRPDRHAGSDLTRTGSGIMITGVYFFTPAADEGLLIGL